MTFAGWDHVAGHLATLVNAPGQYLNAGQRDSLRSLAARLPRHGVVIADEVGMGKTRIAVALTHAVSKAGGRVAILIPPTLAFQWREELRHGGVPNVADVVRSLLGFLGAWDTRAPARPWFEQSVVLVSHGFTNWRLGITTQRWRFELLPMLAGYAHHALHGHYPYGFKVKRAHADVWVRAAAKSIAEFSIGSDDLAVRRRYEGLNGVEAWRSTNVGANYEQGGEPRRLLQWAVGLGLGAFDLVIVDEAHKSRGEDSGLSRLLEDTLLSADASRRLCMTATPVELSAGDWNQALARIQVDPAVRAQIRAVAERYGAAARRVRLGWRSSAEARDDYVAAAGAFEAALKSFVLRRGKRSDEAVILFRETTRADALSAQGPANDPEHRDPDAYRWQHDIAVRPDRLPLDWRRAVCAAEALSFVVHGHDDPTAKRLRLTFGNGHGIATQLDASVVSVEDEIVQPGNLEPEMPSANVEPEELGLGPEQAPATSGGAKRFARAVWWRGIIDRVAQTEGALYDHPAILAAVAVIEDYDSRREKVLVFGRFTGPMRALVDLLNARAMLRALDVGDPWPQRELSTGSAAAVAAAHRQLSRLGVFDPAVIDAVLARQYAGIARRREALRTSLFDLIVQGLPEHEHDARTLAEAARTGSDEARATLAAAIDQLLDHGRRTDAGSADAPQDGTGNAFSPAAIAEAFVALISALRERGEGDADSDGTLSTTEAGTLWHTLAKRLDEEYGTERGRFARMMNGGTQLPTRRALQLAFNRPESNPRVLVAQSIVGREGLNLHEACRVVILLHPEWNPGVVEQQVGRIDRVGSRWSRDLEVAARSGERPLPRIEVRPVIFEGTYDAHHWRVLHERWDDLRAQLHGVVVPYRLRKDCTDEELVEIRRLDTAAPNFEPVKLGN